MASLTGINTIQFTGGITNGYKLPLPPQDANGFTIIPALQSGVNYYVSSSTGNDSNNGLTSGTAKATLSAGIGLMRNGYGDHLLLKCGDTWSSGQNFGGISNLAGASRTDPMVIATYGTGARPIVQTATGNGVTRLGTSFTGYFWIFSINFYSDTSDPANAGYGPGNIGTTGISILGNTTNLLVEDCVFNYYDAGFIIQLDDGNPSLPVQDIIIRRNQVINSYTSDPSSSHSQGMYLYGILNLLVDGNVLNHNGWYEAPTVSPTPAETALAAVATRNTFNHNVYSLNNNYVTFENNLSTNGSNFGLTMSVSDNTFRYNSVLVINNLFIGDANGITTGNHSNSVFQNNIFTAIGGSPGGTDQSVGMYVNNSVSINIENNFFINKSSLGSSAEFIINSGTTHNLNFINNTIYGWGGEDGTGSGIINNGTSEVNVVLTPNSISLSNWPRDVTTYDTVIGGPGTIADFITQCIGNIKSNYNYALTASAAVANITGVPLITGGLPSSIIF